jgi:hypothetical protein
VRDTSNVRNYPNFSGIYRFLTIKIIIIIKKK